MASDSPDRLPPTVASLARQLRQHLASLEAAGVEWLPSRPLPEGLTLSSPARPAETAAEATPDPGTERRVALEVLAEKVSACARCPSLASSRTRTVFGVGPLDPELCLIGEAPGADEDRMGEPFVGAAGQLLNRILSACGFRREDVYICNTLKCRPPGNRPPQADEAANCNEYLLRQLELVRPRYILCLGGTAAKYLLGTAKSVGALRGKVLDFHGIPVVVTYHPAYMLPHRVKGPEDMLERKRMVWEDMKFLMTKLGRPVVEKKGS